jgi:hypothetical protein
VTGWDVYGGRASVPAGMLAELAALRAELPGYDVILTSHSPTCRFEAIHRGPGPGIWCLISSDPADLWRELAGRARPTAAGQTARPAIFSNPAARIPRIDSAKARPAGR